MSEGIEAVKERVAAEGVEERAGTIGTGVEVCVNECMDGHEYAGVIEDRYGRSLFRVRLPYTGKDDLLRVYMFRPAQDVVVDNTAMSRHQEAAHAYCRNNPRPPSEKDLDAVVEECCGEADWHK